LLVLVTSVRAYQRGNQLALYTFLGYFIFTLTTLTFVIPLSFSDFRSNESDLHYYAEAFRAVIFAVGVADRFRRVRRDAVQAELEKKQIAFEKELQMQAERDRIRRDLHDSLGGQLSSISVGLNQMMGTEKNGRLEALQSLADNAITELRDSLWVLDKREISLDELEQRINTLFWQYRKIDATADMELQMKGSSHQPLPSVTAGHLFRIIQEAVQNAVKHSGAQKIEVGLQIEDGVLSLSVRDNGKGFIWPSSPQQDHFGLHNMQKRAEQIQASFMIHSAPDQGTAILVKLKMEAPDGHSL
jgi:signal transduction histidine kinase